MRNYVVLSLETHLFFARIMKEHALFLEAGFPCKDSEWIQKAEWFRRQFEQFLQRVVQVSQGMIDKSVLESGEIVTSYIKRAEEKTQQLSGISINSSITEMEHKLRSGSVCRISRGMLQEVQQLNRTALRLVSELIVYKEHLLEEMKQCYLFNGNYPLLVEHITREARMYRSIMIELSRSKSVSRRQLGAMEDFWNRIMMEHALFIRGLLDPSETQLIETADQYAKEYCELLETAQNQECRVENDLCRKSLEETLSYREFKTAGAKGILNCEISSIILPLLADHVLREANHYIRLLEEECGNEKEQTDSHPS